MLSVLLIKMENYFKLDSRHFLTKIFLRFYFPIINTLGWYTYIDPSSTILQILVTAFLIFNIITLHIYSL